MSESKNRKTCRYDDMLDLEHPVSKKHPQMSRYDRAAQFSPFAALTGHEAAVKEAARITERKVELDDGEKERLDETLYALLEKYHGHPRVRIVYFCPDERKAGGEYRTETDRIQKLDPFGRTILLDNQSIIPLDQIVEIEEQKETDFI